MASQESTPKREFSPMKKAQMYLCLVPAFGVIPAILNLATNRGNRELKNVSKVSIVLAILWLISYGAVGTMGQDNASNQMSLELFKATFNSGYFALSIWLMFRLYKGKSISLPKLSNSNKHDK